MISWTITLSNALYALFIIPVYSISLRFRSMLFSTRVDALNYTNNAIGLPSSSLPRAVDDSQQHIDRISWFDDLKQSFPCKFIT
jgi:hypothetical protein